MRSASSAGRGGEKRREAAALSTTQGTTCNMLPKRGPPTTTTTTRTTTDNNSSSRAPTTNEMLVDFARCLGRSLSHCLRLSQRRDATNWQRVGKQGGAAAERNTLIKHSRLSLARPPAGEQHQHDEQQQQQQNRSPLRWMTPMTLSVCVRANAHEDCPGVCNRDGSMRAALSVTNVPLFCFIVS